MFNQLPLFLRNTTVCSVYSFKKKLDLYLYTVPDIPCQPGFTNSLDHGDLLLLYNKCCGNSVIDSNLE